MNTKKPRKTIDLIGQDALRYKRIQKDLGIDGKDNRLTMATIMNIVDDRNKQLYPHHERILNELKYYMATDDGRDAIDILLIIFDAMAHGHINETTLKAIFQTGKKTHVYDATNGGK